MTLPDASIVLRDASVVLGNRTVWSEGSLEIPQGSITAIIGPNGSGKTTLLRMLLGLLPAATGSVEVFGEAPRRGNPRIGYVPQHYTDTVGDAIRCRDLVRLGVTGTRWGLGRKVSDETLVDHALSSVGALEFADRRMSELSGGQQQRVAIAQALVGEPEMLLLDEPLANLDLRNQREVVDLLGALRSQHGVTILVVVHDLNPLLPELDGAVYLLDGHAHYGPVAEVVDEELLTHLYGTKVKVVRTVQGDLFTRGA